LLALSFPVYTDWWLVTRLCALGAPLESTGPDGVTPLLHWCGSGCTPNVMQHGASLEAVDSEGNGCLHALVTSMNLRAIEAIGGDDFFCRSLGSWHILNKAGKSAYDMSTALKHVSRSIHDILATASATHRRIIAPFLHAQLATAIPVKDLAAICIEYIDGSGRRFAPIVEDASDEEEEDEATPPPAVPAGGLAVVPLDAEEHEEPPMEDEADEDDIDNEHDNVEIDEEEMDGFEAEGFGEDDLGDELEE
jgi:hypothetical protein